MSQIKKLPDRSVVEVFDDRTTMTETNVNYTNSKYKTVHEAMDKLRGGYDLFKFDGDIIFFQPTTNKYTSFSDLLIKPNWTKEEIDIVTAFTTRPMVRYAIEGVIPLEPKGSNFNMCQRICSARSQITKSVTTIEEIVSAIEEEFGEWTEMIYVKASESVTGKTFGFNVRPGGISPLWLPLLSKAASSPVHEEAAVFAYQCMMAHMYTNREQFCALSIADHELIRAASIVQTLRSAFPGSLQYCRALNMAKDAMADYCAGCYKTEAASNDHAKLLNLKYRKGKNPFVSYANHGEMASARFKDRGKKKSQSKYGKLNSYEKKEIENLFQESKDLSTKGSLELFNDGFRLSGNKTKEQKSSFVRIKLPTFMKSDGNYIELSLNEGFGQIIKSFRFTKDSFKETRTNKSWTNKGLDKGRYTTKETGFVSCYKQEAHDARKTALDALAKDYKYEVELWQKVKERKQQKQRKTAKQSEEKEEVVVAEDPNLKAN